MTNKLNAAQWEAIYKECRKNLQTEFLKRRSAVGLKEADCYSTEICVVKNLIFQLLITGVCNRNTSRKHSAAINYLFSHKPITLTKGNFMAAFVKITGHKDVRALARYLGIALLEYSHEKKIQGDLAIALQKRCQKKGDAPLTPEETYSAVSFLYPELFQTIKKMPMGQRLRVGLTERLLQLIEAHYKAKKPRSVLKAEDSFLIKEEGACDD